MAKIVMVLRKILNWGLTTGVLVKTRKYLQKFSISDLFYSKNTSLSKKDPKIAISSYFKYFLQIVNAFFKIINSKKQIGQGHSEDKEQWMSQKGHILARPRQSAQTCEPFS